MMWSSAELSQLTNAIAELKKSDQNCEIEGSGYHKWTFKTVVLESTVCDFESRYGVVLPADYRTFLTKIGNGGAGPCSGLWPLGCRVWRGVDLLEVEEDFSAVLNQDWPHSGPWNDLVHEPMENQFGSVVKNGIHYPNENYWAAAEKHEEYYFSDTHISGAIPICDAGSSLIYLVLNGQDAGSVWSDDRINRNGIHPVQLNGEGSNFKTWYFDWLEQVLAK